MCARQHLPQHSFKLVFKKHGVCIGCFGILLKKQKYLYYIIYICVCVIHCTYTLRNLTKYVCCFIDVNPIVTQLQLNVPEVDSNGAWDDPWETTEQMGCHIFWLRWGIYGMYVAVYWGYMGILGYTGISNLSIPYSHFSLGYDHSFLWFLPTHKLRGPLAKMRVIGVSNSLWISFHLPLVDYSSRNMRKENAQSFDGKWWRRRSFLASYKRYIASAGELSKQMGWVGVS